MAGVVPGTVVDLQDNLMYKNGPAPFAFAVITVLIVLFLLWLVLNNTVGKVFRWVTRGKRMELFEDVEGFADTSATAIMCKQVMEGRPSLCDNIDKAEAEVAAAKKKSTLTGYRDVPVFFQDYNNEMVRKGATIKNEREGYYDPEDFEEPEVYQDGEDFENEDFEEPEYYQDGEDFENEEYEDGYEAFEELPSENAVDNVKPSDLYNALAGR
jgi:hypothetical protein